MSQAVPAVFSQWRPLELRIHSEWRASRRIFACLCLSSLFREFDDVDARFLFWSYRRYAQCG